MKKVFSLFAILCATTFPTKAQNFVFTDKDGIAYDDGATIVIDTPEIDDFGNVLLDAGLYVKNIAAPKNYQVRVVSEITKIDNGKLQVCFPTQCHFYTTRSTNDSEEAQLAEGEMKSIMSEWLPDGEGSYGECIVTYQALALQPLGKTFTKKGGPKITARFVYSDPAAIAPITNETAKVAGRYDLYGRRTTNGHPGITIVRTADGKVLKKF